MCVSQGRDDFIWKVNMVKKIYLNLQIWALWSDSWQIIWADEKNMDGNSESSGKLDTRPVGTQVFLVYWNHDHDWHARYK